MATIKFTTNLHPFQNGGAWQFHPNFFEGKDAHGNDVCDGSGKKISFPVPNEAGVYIVGVKIGVNDPPQLDKNGNQLTAPDNEKFCPLYVGIKDKLVTKISGHRNPDNRNTSIGELNSFKEIFDLINKTAKEFYNDISYFDSKYISQPRLTQDEEHKKAIFSTLKIPPYNNSLIWFPDFNFFDIYLGATVSAWDNSHNCGHQRSLNAKGTGELDAIMMKGILEAKDLRNKIDNVKKLIENKYWYAFATAKDIANAIKLEKTHPLYKDACDYDGSNYMIKKAYGPGRRLCESVENATKEALKRIAIYTYAKANNPKHTLQIDLTDIKGDLVNMTGKPFPISSGKFII